MTNEEFANLGVGDIVRSKSSRREYQVMANFGGRVTAVEIADLTHPDEWELVSRVMQRVKYLKLPG